MLIARARPLSQFVFLRIGLNYVPFRTDLLSKRIDEHQAVSFLPTNPGLPPLQLSPNKNFATCSTSLSPLPERFAIMTDSL